MTPDQLDSRIERASEWAAECWGKGRVELAARLDADVEAMVRTASILREERAYQQARWPSEDIEGELFNQRMGEKL